MGFFDLFKRKDKDKSKKYKMDIFFKIKIINKFIDN